MDNQETRKANGLIRKLQETGGQRFMVQEEQKDKLIARIRTESQKRIRTTLTMLELGDRHNMLVKNKARGVVLEVMEELAPELPKPTQIALATQIVDELLGYGPLEPLMQEGTGITEVIVCRYDKIYIEKRGQLIKTDVYFRDEEHCRDVLERILAPTGRRIDLSNPEVSARLPDGSRLMAHIPPIAVNGTTFTIRRFTRGMSAEELVRKGMFNEEIMDFLRSCVQGSLNIVCSGGTGAGKTTVLNVLAQFIPEAEAIVTIEDTAELQLSHENVRSLECRPANIEGQGEITLRQLVKAALRMRPDRIIVGESRGDEAWDMLQAMTTGHNGSLTTAHADTAEECLNERLADMVRMAKMGLPHEAIIGKIASAIEIVVQVCRDKDGRRRIEHIIEVTGTKLEDNRYLVETQILYDYNPDEGTWEKVAKHFKHQEILRWRGIEVNW
ncbi:MAG: CpaF family protein [Candidatus Saccharibacteria bacterium]